MDKSQGVFQEKMRFERCNLQAMSLALEGIAPEEATRLAMRIHCTEISLLAADKEEKTLSTHLKFYKYLLLYSLRESIFYEYGCSRKF